MIYIRKGKTPHLRWRNKFVQLTKQEIVQLANKHGLKYYGGRGYQTKEDIQYWEKKVGNKIIGFDVYNLLSTFNTTRYIADRTK